MAESQLSAILKLLMFKKDIKTTELARRTGVPQQTLQRIVTGVSPRPHLTTLEPLAEFFKLTIAQLKGQEPIPNLYDNLPGQTQAQTVNRIPVIDWHEVPAWPNIDLSDRRTIPSDLKSDAGLFALAMPDSSMEPVFPAGTILIFDPARPAKDRQYVIAKTPDEQRAAFRQLLVDNQHRYLKPISPDFQPLPTDKLHTPDEICGTLVQARRDYWDS
jgi:SOS-response transcriptional repressor LexA